MKIKMFALLAVLLLVGAFAAFGTVTIASAQGPTPNPNPAPFGPWGGWGMMGGYNWGYAPTQTITPTVPYGTGWGCDGWDGWGGMMGGYRYGYAPNVTPLKLDDAVSRAQQYVAAYNNSDLKLAEVEEYAWNFYGLVKEKSTGNGAFEIIVDKYSGAVSPEMGPNMMWNTKYSPMTNMLGGWLNQPPGKMTLTVEQARVSAAQYLKTYLPNATVEEKGDSFYGYYHFDALQNGKTYGMLSVNGYTGAVWFHTWHGDFIAAKTLD
jgi:hypothetical protein